MNLEVTHAFEVDEIRPCVLVYYAGVWICGDKDYKVAIALNQLCYRLSRYTGLLWENPKPLWSPKSKDSLKGGDQTMRVRGRRIGNLLVFVCLSFGFGWLVFVFLISLKECFPPRNYFLLCPNISSSDWNFSGCPFFPWKSWHALILISISKCKTATLKKEGWKHSINGNRNPAREIQIKQRCSIFWDRKILNTSALGGLISHYRWGWQDGEVGRMNHVRI